MLETLTPILPFVFAAIFALPSIGEGVGKMLLPAVVGLGVGTLAEAIVSMGLLQLM